MNEQQHTDAVAGSGHADDAADPQQAPQQAKSAPRQEERAPSAADQAEEVGGPAGPEPTRYGDWERKGRCIDF